MRNPGHPVWRTGPQTVSVDYMDSTNDEPGGLWRSVEDRYLGGVAAGVAERFGLDPFAPRAAFLGGTLFAAYAADWIPIIPLGYTVLWLFVPERSGDSIIGSIRTRGGLRQAAAAVAVFVVIAVLLSSPALGVALLLAALAWVLLNDDRVGTNSLRRSGPGVARTTSHQPAGPVPEPTGSQDLADTPLAPPPTDAAPSDAPLPDAAPVDAQAMRAAPIDVSIPGDTFSPPSAARWGQSRRLERGEPQVSEFADRQMRTRRQPALWPLTLALLTLVALGVAIANQLVEPGVDPGVGVNLALVVIGGVILLSAWRGRALWTSLLALALLPAWVGFSVADVGRFEGTGTFDHTPTQLPVDGELAYENGYGTMNIDLRNLPLADGDDVAVNVDTTAGFVRIEAPLDARIIVKSHIGVGSSEVRGNGLQFYEYDREPHLDRTTVRSYPAYGAGCVREYWATWEQLVAEHRAGGVELGELSALEADDVDAILNAIGAAGFEPPTPVDALPFEPEPFLRRFSVVDEFGNEIAVLTEDQLPGLQPNGLRILDELGNEVGVFPPEGLTVDPSSGLRLQPATPSASTISQRTWSYPATSEGGPCMEQAPPDNPATITIDATIGIGSLEVIRNEF